MIKYSTLPIGEKLRQIRTAKGLSQENIADATGSTAATISRIESGKSECTDKMLADIKKAMDVEKAPLHEHELKIYESQLWTINELAEVQRTAEARALQENLFPLINLPYELDLSLLYSMIDVRLLFQESNIAAGEEQLDKADAFLENASTEVNHLYHRNRGSTAAVRGDLKTALKHFLQVLDLQSDMLKPGIGIIYNIASMYARLGKPLHAIRYYDRIMASSSDRTFAFGADISFGLAQCNFEIRDFKTAIKVLHQNLAHARSVNDKKSIAAALAELGNISTKQGNAEKSLEFFEESLTFLQDMPHDDIFDIEGNRHNYISALIGKAQALSMLKKRTQCQEVLERVRTLVEGDELYTICVNAIGHLVTIKESKSCDYLENVAIPYLRVQEGQFISFALEICDHLEEHYKKNKALKKAMAVAVMSRDILMEMFMSEIE